MKDTSSRAKRTAVLLLLATAVLAAGVASAQARWIDATLSTDLGPILRDEIRDRVYLGDSATNEVVVIDTLTEQVVERIALPGPVADLALTKSGHALGVVGGGFFTSIDLYRPRVRSWALPAEVTGEATSIAFGALGHVFLGTGRNTFGWLYVLNWKATKVLTDFGLGPNETLPPYNPLLRTDDTGTILYIADRGLSPLSIHKFNVTYTKNPGYLADDAHGSLGSNLQDLALSNRFDEVYVASGSPYGIQVVDASDMSHVVTMTTGAYPTAVTVGPLGKKVFGAPGSPYNNFLFEFDAVTQTEIRNYVLDVQALNGQAQPRGLAIDRFGEKAFVIHGSTHPSYLELKVQVIDLVQAGP